MRYNVYHVYVHIYIYIYICLYTCDIRYMPGRGVPPLHGPAVTRSAWDSQRSVDILGVYCHNIPIIYHSIPPI